MGHVPELYLQSGELYGSFQPWGSRPETNNFAIRQEYIKRVAYLQAIYHKTYSDGLQRIQRERGPIELTMKFKTGQIDGQGQGSTREDVNHGSTGGGDDDDEDEKKQRDDPRQELYNPDEPIGPEQGAPIYLSDRPQDLEALFTVFQLSKELPEV